MRIALITYEFSGIANGGGIGTYFRELCSMMRERNNSVEVFTSCKEDAESKGDGIHTIVSSRKDFSQRVAQAFAARHREAPFDVIESAEYGADARRIASIAPDIAHVVKLHTPSYVVGEINNAYLDRKAKARFVIGALRRGRRPKPSWNRYDPATDIERHVTLSAHEITSPSQSLARIVAQEWQIPEADISVVPNSFTPAANILDIEPSRTQNLVTFIGKLEVRKGVVELAKAIPSVLSRYPNVRFRFIGRSMPHPATKQDMVEYLKKLIGPGYLERVDFVGGIPYQDVPRHLSESDIAVFPSYWENFPYVCLEAMAAACGVVGSSSGGMAEMIEHGRTGRLINPKKPREIADAIISLLKAPERRIEMGKAARQHVIDTYSAERIAPLQEASYQRAIARARERVRVGITSL